MLNPLAWSLRSTPGSVAEFGLWHEEQNTGTRLRQRDDGRWLAEGDLLPASVKAFPFGSLGAAFAALITVGGGRKFTSQEMISAWKAMIEEEAARPEPEPRHRVLTSSNFDDFFSPSEPPLEVEIHSDGTVSLKAEHCDFSPFKKDRRYCVKCGYLREDAIHRVAASDA